MDTIRVLSEEYVKSFVVKSRLKDLSLDDKRKRYFYLLNSTGVYHDLKEKLKVRAGQEAQLRLEASRQPYSVTMLIGGKFSLLTRGLRWVGCGVICLLPAPYSAAGAEAVRQGAGQRAREGRAGQHALLQPHGACEQEHGTATYRS